jgi:co-chaperonin GroES (HSP10)
MKTMNLFVVKVDKPINDTIVTEGGLELFIDTKFNEFEHRTIEGEVVSSPLLIENDVQPGDTLYFHHLVVVEGGQKISWEDNHYYVNCNKDFTISNQAFAYKKKGTDNIIPLFGWCLLEEVPQEEDAQEQLIEIVSIEDKLPTTGIVSFEAKCLDDLGVKQGDEVAFAKNMDYRVKIDGKEYYRVRSEDLLYVKK